MKQISLFTMIIFATLTLHAQQPAANTVGAGKMSGYALGNFLIRVTINPGQQPQINVVNKTEPERVLWGTVPGVALIGAAVGKDSIRLHGVPQGSFTITDKILKQYDSQTIEKVITGGERVIFVGQLSGKAGSV